MDFDLAGRTALVAGGTSGIGLGVSIALAREGAKVEVCGRSQSKIDDALGQIEAVANEKVGANSVDITSDESVQKWVSGCVGKHGIIDVLVVNSGGPQVGHATEVPIEEYARAYNTNVLGLIRVVKAALPHMRDKRGRVILVGSITAKDPVRTIPANGTLVGLAASNAVRPAVLGFMQSLVTEIGDRGITVNTICPGYYRTDRAIKLLGEPEFNAILVEQKVPIGRFGTPEEFGNVAAFLASGPASYLTGCCIAVDGGVTRGLY